MKTDVLVLGAGVAGLAAARELQRRGVAVTVLEARDRETVPTWWRPRPFDSTVLVGWAAGPRAQELSGAAQTLTAARLAVQSLERAFGVEGLGAQLDAWKVIDWSADPFARGGYLVVPVGQLPAQRLLQRPLEDTLFFAGEHTDTQGQAGTVHGALATGQRAAKLLLEVR